MQNDQQLTTLQKAILQLQTVNEVDNFFSDLMTPGELKAINERWKVCQLLHTKKLSYREIQKLTKASLTTISRVARFLHQEQYKGYKIVLERLMSNSKNND